MAQERSVFLNGQEIPSRCLVGEFELLLVELTAGKPDRREGVFRGVAGTALLRLPCARPPIFGPVLEHPDVMRLNHAVEVVTDVLYPQTQISVADAQVFRPDAQVGETVSLGIEVERAGLGAIVGHARGVPDWLSAVPHETGFPVDLRDVTISVEKGTRLSRIVDGAVAFPAAGKFRRPIEITIAGFTLTLSSIELSPGKSTAAASVQAARRADRCRLLPAGDHRSRHHRHVAALRVLHRRTRLRRTGHGCSPTPG